MSPSQLTLRTPRLLLREFRDDDWRPVLAYQSDPRYLRYYAWTGRSEAEVREFVRGFVEQQQWAPRTRYQLAIVLPEEGKFIGNVGIRIRDPRSQEADIGYELGPDYWGNGYATEAAREIVRFGFEQLALHRISSWCVEDNAASARVLQKVGMQLEGRLREKESYKGRWRNHLLYAILEPEWRRDLGAPR
jgi:[ribosomal protein S5]-alanine N-acetyltransferase